MKLSDSSSSSRLEDEKWAPGFRFHPTDEELVLYYLKRKICRKRLELDVIRDVDVYKREPEELPGLSRLKSGDRQWFFFSPRDRKYPNGARSNRATEYGYWKATGKDRIIMYSTRSVGVKKTLVFYKGRAPSGQRTDWVMHEYTLDEEEYKRCQAARDYYALYKVFKKSGPGPKNGEQYGAPFKEEEWADIDECSNVNDHVLVDNSVNTIGADYVEGSNVNDRVLVDNSVNTIEARSIMDDLDELMNRIGNEPVNVQQLVDDFDYHLHQVVADEETQSSMVHSSITQSNFHPNSDTIFGEPEVTFAPNPVEEDFLEDFLEMDDLISPELNIQGTENPVENLPQFDELDGLCEFDLADDVDMFLHGVGPDSCLSSIENEQSCQSSIENDAVNLVQYSYLHTSGSDTVTTVSQSFSGNFDNDMVNRLEYHLQPHSVDSNFTGGQLWEQGQESRVYTTPAETTNYRITTETVSGAVNVGNTSNPNSGASENRTGEEGNGSRGSWLSSTLWGFLESIPTTPASASENGALMNRALERVSSFSRSRMNPNNNNSFAVNPTNSRGNNHSYKSKKGLLWFSILGVVCAIFCMFLLGTSSSSKVLGRFISS